MQPEPQLTYNLFDLYGFQPHVMNRGPRAANEPELDYRPVCLVKQQTQTLENAQRVKDLARSESWLSRHEKKA